MIDLRLFSYLTSFNNIEVKNSKSKKNIK